MLTVVVAAAPMAATDRQTSRLQLDGLDAPVRIARDSGGFPHIFAETDHDAWFVLGYLHARDRFFQMDFARRSYSGTLAELQGPEVLDQDILARTAGLRRAAEESWPVYSPEVKQVLEAYSRGVNAWLNSPEFVLPPEYHALEISRLRGWSPVDSLTVAKGIAFGLSFDLGDVERTEDVAAYRETGTHRGFDGDALFFQDLFRVAPFDPTVTVPQEAGSGAQTALRPRGRADGPDPAEGIDRQLLRRTLERFRRWPLFRRGLRGDEIRQGSNFWLVGGQHTASGFPMIANDPHRSLEAPVVFYEVHVTVRADPGAGAMNVWGVGFPGVPGIAQGCNDRVCWGSTVNPMDVTDVYQERLTVNILTRRITGTIFEGRMEPVVSIPQVFRVNQPGNQVLDDVVDTDVGPDEGGITYLVPRRNQGPIISVDTSNPFNVKGLSLQYAGWRATRELESILRFGRSRNLEDFKEALQYFDLGSQNWAYADVEGNIAYFTSGELPLREDLEAGALQGAQPWFVRDGTHTVPNEWLPASTRPPGQALAYRILPFGEMPQLENPEQGYIVSANNDPIGTTLDNDVLNQFRPSGGILYLNVGYTGLRAGRIRELLERKILDHPAGLTVQDLMEIQADHQLIDAPVFVPAIVEAAARGVRDEAPAALRDLAQQALVVEAVNYLRNWDYTSPTGIQTGYDPGDDPDSLPEPSETEIRNSVAATLYSLWRSRILANTIDAVLERVGLGSHRPDSERSLSALRHLLEQFDTRQGVGYSGLNFFEVGGIGDPSDARDFLILKSLEEALARAASAEFAPAFGESANLRDYRWGYLHRVVFSHPLGSGFTVPPAGGFPDLSPQLPGLARPGGFEVVDASGHSARADGVQGFRFGSGPARRFVAEMDPAGIRAFQMVAGGPGGDPSEPEYASDLKRWLTNRYRQIQLSAEIATFDPVDVETLEPAAYRLRFPYLRATAAEFAGYAAAEIAGGPVELRFSGFAADGTLLPPDPARAVIPLAAGTQAASLGSELFAAAGLKAGWVELELGYDAEPPIRWPAVASFYQFGDFALGRLDGGTSVLGTVRRLVLTRIYEDTNLVGRPAATRVFVINPNPETVSVELRLYRGEAGVVTVDQNLAPRSILHFTPSEVFGEIPMLGAFLEVVVVDGGGILAFQGVVLDGGRSVLALNGLPAPGTAIQYSAQLAEVPPVIRTSVRLFNTGEFARVVRFRAVSGQNPAGSVSPDFILAGGTGREWLFEEMFPGLAVPFVGSLVVEADGAGVVGDIAFVDPQGGRFASILALQGQPFRKAVFGHVADLGDFFTGLAFFNVGDADARVAVEVYNPAGTRTGLAQLDLKPGERLSLRLVELLDEPVAQAGGYVVVQSSEPLVGQEIFGTLDLRLQSAVPPVLVE
jgi:penicillin amidase